MSVDHLRSCSELPFVFLLSYHRDGRFSWGSVAWPDRPILQHTAGLARLVVVSVVAADSGSGIPREPVVPRLRRTAT
jgi:hypothetical protein